jgi:hypothetical protein
MAHMRDAYGLPVTGLRFFTVYGAVWPADSAVPVHEGHPAGADRLNHGTTGAGHPRRRLVQASSVDGPRRAAERRGVAIRRPATSRALPHLQHPPTPVDLRYIRCSEVPGRKAEELLPLQLATPDTWDVEIYRGVGYRPTAREIGCGGSSIGISVLQGQALTAAVRVSAAATM